MLWEIILKDLLGTKSDIDSLINNLPDNIQGSYEIFLDRCPNRALCQENTADYLSCCSSAETLVEMDIALRIDDRISLYAKLDKKGPDRLQETLRSRCSLIVSVIEDKLFFYSSNGQRISFEERRHSVYPSAEFGNNLWTSQGSQRVLAKGLLPEIYHCVKSV